MVLTDIALTRINNREVRLGLMVELCKTEQTIINYINQNKNNGPLTSPGAIKVIKHHTKLTNAELLQEQIVTKKKGVKLAV